LLAERGLSARSIESFFRPFFSGVFLEEALETPADMFLFVFRMFATGSACLPERGMREIPLQLVSKLPPESVKTSVSVVSIEATRVQLENGEAIDSAAVVLATDCDAGARLLGLPTVDSRWRRTTTMHFRSTVPPHREPLIALNGTGTGLINNVVVPTNLSPGYSAADATLITVSLRESALPEDGSLEARVVEELCDWFGPELGTCSLLKRYDIAKALPVRFGSSLQPEYTEAAETKGVYLAGDYLINPSINAALGSGRQAAARVLESKALSS
jgi:hypothetical protein